MGIGAVLSAGLIANLDVKDKPTAGHFWSYCGLNDNNRAWIGKEKTKTIINEILGDKKNKDITYEDFVKCCLATKWKPENLIEATGKDNKKIFLSADGEKYNFKKEDIISQCAKRPYNAKMKTLCCHPNTLIRTQEGYKPIKDIEVGDYVLTHKGNYKKVTQVFVNKCENNKLSQLSLFGHGMSPLLVTDYHPIYITKTKVYDIERKREFGIQKSFRRKNLAKFKVGKDELEQIKLLYSCGETMQTISEMYKISVPYVSNIVNNKTKIEERFEEEIGWSPAKDIKGGYLGLVVSPLTFDKDLDVLPLDIKDAVLNENNFVASEGRWNGVKAPKSVYFNPNISLTDETLRLIGFFIAEGHTSKNTIGFSFNIKEKEYIEFTKRMIKDLFNQTPYENLQHTNNSIQVCFGNKLVADNFRALFGSGAKNKHIPEMLMNISKTKITHILRGLFQGDGSIKDNCIQYTTISHRLALQVYDILTSLGISTKLCVQEKFYKLTINDEIKFFEEIFGKSISKEKVHQHYKRQEKDGVWYEFRTPYEVDYIGNVYNLEVEDDNSYIANGIAVHNCWKISQSFVKVSNNPNDIYGKIYQQRKAYETLKNDNFEYKEQALECAKKVGKTTEAYKYYSIGKLPPAHIQARAERKAVQIFLSHLHKVMYMNEYGKEPPKPFAIDILKHAHEIPCPNL